MPSILDVCERDFLLGDAFPVPPLQQVVMGVVVERCSYRAQRTTRYQTSGLHDHRYLTTTPRFPSRTQKEASTEAHRVASPRAAQHVPPSSGLVSPHP